MTQLWALDLEDGWPIRAHRIVEVRTTTIGGEDREERVTACGEVLHRWNHPQGWSEHSPGEDPLQEHAIHCR